ncbi:hypothetical protein [Bacillus sp. RB3]|uniref:hypothetical protein n=1 Tax=Bacillus sp. RB3 TaxID=3050012 RepID=UPI00253F9515|nr:hypothetical protein [Bacillus sp. RB3]MDK3014502.1 hypothetical protein [Bacillus sp. RB3]
MSGFYPKAKVKLSFGTIGANVYNFVSTVQVENRIDDLKRLEHNLESALEMVRNEKRILEVHLNQGN